MHEINRTCVDVTDADRVRRPGRRSDVLRAYLDAHRLVWDMPSLAEIHPEVLAHLEARYEVADSGPADTGIRHLATGRVEVFATTDLRSVVDSLLTRELLAATAHEGSHYVFRPLTFQAV
ncbi:MAG: hypothetical protein CMH83_15295 [Nocardioides sp.]|nr:hypothetical protein [Nocardioides sp.]